MKKNSYDPNVVMDVCLLAGEIMLKSGAETYRVEDTMMRIANSFGIGESHSYVTPTGIIFSVESDVPTKTRLIRILDRSNDLRKVTEVNSISRQINSGDLDLQQAYRMLKKLETEDNSFPFIIRILAAAIASGCFLIMFKGIWEDFLAAFLSGGIGYFSVIFFHKLVPIRFFAEFLAAFFIGLTAFLSVKFGIGYELDKIIIGSVMPLVPGLLLTNAVRDLMAGHLVSGLSKGAEAGLTAFAIGSGIAVVLSLFL